MILLVRLVIGAVLGFVGSALIAAILFGRMTLPAHRTRWVYVGMAVGVVGALVTYGRD